MAGNELENYATVHEKSNQQSEKQSFPNTNLHRLGKTDRYLQLRSFTFLRCTISTQDHRYTSVDQWIFFPKLNISIKHRQIGGQSLRFALQNRFWITVGCLLLWRTIRWFQQSREFLKGSGSSDVCQVSVGPTRASPLHPSLDCRNDRSWLPTLRSHV